MGRLARDPSDRWAMLHRLSKTSERGDPAVRNYRKRRVKALPNDLTDREPSVPWHQIAGFRDVLAPRLLRRRRFDRVDAAANKAPQFLAACRRCWRAVEIRMIRVIRGQ